MHNISINGCIFIVCVGGIDLTQWKQGNTCFKSIFKRSLSEGSFFCEFLEMHEKNI